MYFLLDQGILPQRDNDEMAKKMHKKTKARLTGQAGINFKQSLQVNLVWFFLLKTIWN
jgi:hypothetical protein